MKQSTADMRAVRGTYHFSLKLLLMLPVGLGVFFCLFGECANQLEVQQSGPSPLHVDLHVHGERYVPMESVATDFGLTLVNRGTVALDTCAVVIDGTLRVPLDLVEVAVRLRSRVRGRSDLEPGETLYVPFHRKNHPDVPEWSDYYKRNLYARAKGPYIVELFVRGGSKKWTVRRVAGEGLPAGVYLLVIICVVAAITAALLFRRCLAALFSHAFGPISPITRGST